MIQSWVERSNADNDNGNSANTERERCSRNMPKWATMLSFGAKAPAFVRPPKVLVLACAGIGFEKYHILMPKIRSTLLYYQKGWLVAV